MRNCFDCKFKDFIFTKLLSYKEELSFKKENFVLLQANISSVSGDFYGRCLKGHMEEFEKFQKAHGKTPRREIEKRTDLILSCHEYDDLTKSLDNCIIATNNVLAYLKDKEVKDKKT